MALSKEEIAIRLGVDSRAVGGGLSKAGAQFKKFTSDVSKNLVAAFGFGVILNQIKSTIDRVEQLSNTASSLNVSQDFLQDITNIGVAAGKSQTKVEKLLTIFAKGLKPGQDLEAEFMKFLDEIAETKDPAEKLAKAFERVGKSGKDLLEIAKDGSAAFKELASTFQKLSEDDIAAINKLDAALDGFWNKFQIKIGKAIASTQEFYERLSGKKSPRKQFPTTQEAIAGYLENQKAKKQAEAKKISDLGFPGIIEGPIDPSVGIENDPRYKGRQFSYAQPRPKPRKTGMEAVADYLSQIKSGAESYKAKTDYSQFGKAVADAQAEKSKEYIQKVSIVEVKE